MQDNKLIPFTFLILLIIWAISTFTSSDTFQIIAYIITFILLILLAFLSIKNKQRNLTVVFIILMIPNLYLLISSIIGDEVTIDNVTEDIVESNKPQLYDEEFGKWASKMNKILSEPTDDPRLKEANNDKGFEYYLKAQEVIREFPNQLIEIDKDHSNLFLLSSYISHIQFVRTAHLGPNGEAKESTELADQWKPTNEEMHQAFEYMKQIVNDIDIAVNHNGEGEIFGVTYLLNSENVSQIENFVNGG